MEWYIDIVTKYPIITAMIQFAILGTFGDIVSKWIVYKKIHNPFKYHIILLKMVEWAILAVCIKFAFTGFHGFVDSLVENELLPQLNKFTYALAISITMNLQFGLFLVLLHRILDNLVYAEKNWTKLNKAFLSLLWFWIPAHTITFMLPKPYQIGLAAVWSVVLGIILGFYNTKTNK